MSVPNQTIRSRNIEKIGVIISSPKSGLCPKCGARKLINQKIKEILLKNRKH